MGAILGIKKNSSSGFILEAELFGPPCSDEEIIGTFKIATICNFLKTVTKNPLPLLGMLKYNLQSPVFVEEDNEYNSIFAKKNDSLRKFGYFSQNGMQVKERVKRVLQYSVHS